MPFPDENEIVLPDGITLNAARGTDGVLITCATLDGWGSPGSKGGGQSREGDHGDTPAPNPKLVARMLSMTGRIDAPTRLLRQQTEHRLEAALGLELFEMTVVDGIPLLVRAERNGQVDIVDDTDTKSTWQAELKCPDPLRYGQAQQISMALPNVVGGLRYPKRYPIRYSGSSTTGDYTAVNNGNITAPTVATLFGPLETPKVTNMRTGQWVQYNDTLAPGEFVVLYLRYPLTALLMGTALRTGKVSTGKGGTWGIKPGENPISFRAASGTGTALLDFSDTYQ